MVLYVTFFGAALAIEYHKHIRIDAVAACMPSRRCEQIKPLLFLISAILCALMTWAAMRFWYDDWQYVAEHERWSSILALITPFGFGLLTVHFLLGTLFKQQADEPGS
jgi:TRAP-type C4-dicarboxylate transport system permease small subunit